MLAESTPFMLLVYLIAGSLLFGCSSIPDKLTKQMQQPSYVMAKKNTPDTIQITPKTTRNVAEETFPEDIGSLQKGKSIFVFMDGTSNNQLLPTNIYKIYTLLKQNHDANTIGFYVQGVGNAHTPVAEAFEAGLGFGMEEKILASYRFITKHYQLGDKIYLFGFSRGAHTARSLAGIISYAGIPKITEAERKNDKGLAKIGNRIVDLLKHEKDSDYTEAWLKWKSNDTPPFAYKLKNKKIHGQRGRELQPAEVEFLGVWDTVPGSSFKDYFKKNDLACKEPSTVIKRVGLKGERYKTDSYPPIHFIAHALSNDEKRSMFKPLFVCDAINPKLTTIEQTVFPGAHADVGGGYEDQNTELPNISLNWMVALLSKHYDFPQTPPTFADANAQGLAHLSISDQKGSTGSTCADRILVRSAQKDQSLVDRENASLLPVAVFKKPEPRLSCPDTVQAKYMQERNQESIACVKQQNVNCAYIKQNRLE